MKIYDIAVIGAGPSGIMAAIRAGRAGKNVILIEKNECIGKKIMITGKGRCNVTNSAPIDTFIEKFGREGRYLRSAFHAFFNDDLKEFFESNGLKLKTERQGRVFPETDMAESIVKVLITCLRKEHIRIIYNTRLEGIEKEGDLFCLSLSSRGDIAARKVVIATGGASYGVTGSTGDGFKIASAMGHTITQLVPALVPLTTKDKWVEEAQGLTLKNVRIQFTCGKKKIISDIGEMLITHFGVSGPLVLDLSGRVAALLRERRTIKLSIDLKPGLSEEKLREKLLEQFSARGTTQVKNLMKDFLPLKLIPIFITLSGITSEKTANQITKDERNNLIHLFKGLPLTINGTLGANRAMVTAGGISTKEIDPRTMESRKASGIYFAGEIIDGCAPSGGYNLQQAFSTGYLAGESAGNA